MSEIEFFVDGKKITENFLQPGRVEVAIVSDFPVVAYKYLLKDGRGNLRSVAVRKGGLRTTIIFPTSIRKSRISNQMVISVSLLGEERTEEVERGFEVVNDRPLAPSVDEVGSLNSDVLLQVDELEGEEMTEEHSGDVEGVVQNEVGGDQMVGEVENVDFEDAPIEGELVDDIPDQGTHDTMARTTKSPESEDLVFHQQPASDNTEGAILEEDLSGDDKENDSDNPEEVLFEFHHPEFGEIFTAAQLSELPSPELDESDKMDLRIPVTELETISSMFTEALTGVGIFYISDILTTPAVQLNEKLGFSPRLISSWFDSAFHIYQTPDHPLRLEYREYREEAEKRKEIMFGIVDTPQAVARIEELGLDEGHVETLNHCGYTIIKDLVVSSVAEVVSCGLDKEEAKRIIRIAKLFVGLDRLDKSLWES